MEDLLYNATLDPNHDERAYIAPYVFAASTASAAMGVVNYSFKMRLPSDLFGDLVLIQWCVGLFFSVFCYLTEHTDLILGGHVS